MRLLKVEAALDWAYRQGYAYAERAAEEYASANMVRVEKEDLGQWGDGLRFVSTASP